MNTTTNTTDNGNALAEAQAHLDICKRKLEALDLALSVYDNEEAIEIVRKIEAEGSGAVRSLDTRINYFSAWVAVFKLRHPLITKALGFLGGAE